MDHESYFFETQDGDPPDVASLGNPQYDAEPLVSVTELADALTSCALLPRALTLSTVVLTALDAQRVLGVPAKTASLQALTLPELSDPTDVCALCAPMPRLRSLRLTLNMGHLHKDGSLMSRLWAATPRLAHLAVVLCWGLVPEAPPPQGVCRTAALTLLLRTLADAPCAGTVTGLTLVAASDCPGLTAAAFAPLVDVPVLASLNVADADGQVRATAPPPARPSDNDLWVTHKGQVAAEGDDPLALGLCRLLPRVRLATPYVSPHE